MSLINSANRTETKQTFHTRRDLLQQYMNIASNKYLGSGVFKDCLYIVKLL